MAIESEPTITRVLSLLVKQVKPTVGNVVLFQLNNQNDQARSEYRGVLKEITRLVLTEIQPILAPNELEKTQRPKAYFHQSAPMIGHYFHEEAKYVYCNPVKAKALKLPYSDAMLVGRLYGSIEIGEHLLTLLRKDNSHQLR